MIEFLERDFHSGVHMYVQYGSNQDDGADNLGVISTKWNQNHMLCAMFAGDVICLNGGTEAFEEEEEEAILLVAKSSMDMSLLEYYPVLFENAYVYFLGN